MIHIGDKVKTASNSEILVGVVQEIYRFERGDIYVINIGGELIKRRAGEIYLVQDEKPKQTTDEITISRAEFIKKFIEALDPVRYSSDDPTVNISIMVSGIMILKELEKDLFGEK